MKYKNQKWLVTVLSASVCLASASVRADDKNNESNQGTARGRNTAAALDATDKTYKSDSSEKSDADKSASSDTKFLKDAIKGGKAEVKIGELAQQKAQSDSVKQYGQRLVKDHTEANQKLQQIADQKSVTLSDASESEHQKMVDHLSGLSGEEFDKAFIDHAVTDHKKDIRKFEKEANEGEDPAIRSFARETLPALREHLKLAQALKDNPSASLPSVDEPAGAEKKSDQAEPNQSGDKSEQKDQSQADDQSPTAKP